MKLSYNIFWCKKLSCAKKPLPQVLAEHQEFNDWRLRYRVLDNDAVVILQGHARDRLEGTRVCAFSSFERVVDLLNIGKIRREMYRSVLKWDVQAGAVVYYNDGEKVANGKIPKVATMLFDEETHAIFCIECGKEYFLIKSILDFGPGAECGQDGVVNVNYDTYACVVHKDSSVERLPSGSFPWAKMETATQFRHRFAKKASRE